MKYFYYIITFTCILLWSSCRKDFETQPNPGNLEFSSDSIFLDTIFKGVLSNTQILKVYNRSNDDINIPSISLGLGAASRYQLNVDGLPLTGSELTPESGKTFRNIEILARDSIFVFIEATIDSISNGMFVYEDKINFSSPFKSTDQVVNLFTLVRDANFIFKSETDVEKKFETRQRDRNGDLISLTGYDLSGDDELTMDNTKAHVIYGYAVVPNGKTLTIEAGARIHFHKDSGIIVEEGGNIIINGMPSPSDDPLINEVIIESDRIAEDFDNLPGQWGLIWFQKGSINNSISHTTFKNATTSILIEGNGDETVPSLTLNNVQIYNSQVSGIQANATNITGDNVVINQSGQSSLGIEQGGTYNFTNSTLVNFWSFGSSSFNPSVSISNRAIRDSNVADSNIEEANFTNCIIAGNTRTEIALNIDEDAAFNFKFENCLIDFRDTFIDIVENPQYDFSNTTLYPSTLINEDPKFKNTRLNMLQIGGESAANGKAKILTSSTDIIGTPRSTTAPDIGAYESIIFEKDTDN